MSQAVSLREFNHHIAEYIHRVEIGDEIILTRRGRPIIQMNKIQEKPVLTAEQKAAWKELQASMKKIRKSKDAVFSRDDLHER